MEKLGPGRQATLAAPSRHPQKLLSRATTSTSPGPAKNCKILQDTRSPSHARDGSHRSHPRGSGTPRNLQEYCPDHVQGHNQQPGHGTTYWHESTSPPSTATRNSHVALKGEQWSYTPYHHHNSPWHIMLSRPCHFLKCRIPEVVCQAQITLRCMI